MLAVSTLVAQAPAPTQIKLPKNKYTPAQDVQLGLEAAAEVRKEYPVIDNGLIKDYLARLGDDVSFIPYARDDRMLNFSRFDIDGVTEVRAEDLDAFIFTERGVYRPGDEMKIGLVVKQRNWQGRLAGRIGRRTAPTAPVPSAAQPPAGPVA